MWLLLVINLLGKIAAVWFAKGSVWTAVLLWGIPDLLLAYHFFVPRAQGIVPMFRRFRTDRREVWLTIDDGPDPVDTPQILELLAAHEAKATFFVIGRKVEAFPQLIRDIVAAGHEVGHHTYSHPLRSFWCASIWRLREEIDQGMEVLAKAGVRPTRFRAPATIRNLWLGKVLKSRGLTLVGWSARGLESRCLTVDEAVTRVTRELEPGAILLLHEGPSVPVAMRVHAIRKTLETLETQGYQCVIPKAEQLIV